MTLARTGWEEGAYIVEEPVEGMPLVAAVLFDEGDEGGTDVTFRLSYQLPCAYRQ